MIYNIIFDIGNVLTDFRWKEFLQDKGFQEEMIRRIAKASFLSPLWNEVDRGVWDADKLMKEFVRMDPEIEKELYLAFNHIGGMVAKRDYAIPWIQDLKARGYKVYYLSNFSDKAHRDCLDALDFIPYMDGGILSYQDRMIKPDAKIYQLLLARYELKAQESVFIDDTLANVEAARALGFHGIVFRTKEQVQEELEGILRESQDV
jgi:putative hydrolase of the HAD superfamily